MITKKQLKAARVLLDWDQHQLARAADLSTPTIHRMETVGPERSSAGNVERVRKALEAAGIEFVNGTAYIGVFHRSEEGTEA